MFELQKVEHPGRGFSSAKFLPRSYDTVMVALKSEEISAEDRQTTFITVLKETPPGTWQVVMPETELPGGAKYEGIEILCWGVEQCAGGV